jgi:type IV secretory pathway VirB10-like protein
MKEFQEQLLKRLDRVADTFDRLATVLGYESDAAAIRANPVIVATPAPPPAPAAPVVNGADINQPSGFTFAESGEEYQQRQSRDAAFAISLGVAPWSRDFQTTIMQMKYDLMRPHMENVRDEETGQWRPAEAEGRGEEEAEQIVRDAFKLARAEANVRQGAEV